MKINASLFFFITSLLLGQWVNAQRVGVVLSGGGATGLAHVGVLMALEEAEIPIDYVTGTSAGALVGAMYSCGYSPAEIKAYIVGGEYEKMASGELLPEQRFLLREDFPDASVINFPFAKDSIFKKSLPTNFITPAYMDYEMLRLFGVVGAQVGEDFDRLFVPYRCVASDITKKESVVFRSGKLNAAVRASMTYPFYVNPISIDGVLYFDGGLYNNFPADVMYNEFHADYIIGSNVSWNTAPPTEDDLLSHLRNMLLTPTNFNLPCESGILINPKAPIGTFDFDKSEEAIQIGYISAQKYIDSIRTFVFRRISIDSLAQKRKEFQSKWVPVQINEINASSPNGDVVGFVNRSFRNDSISEALTMDVFTKRYFRVYATPQIKYLYPTIEIKKDSLAVVKLAVSKQKPFALHIGGHFSSRPVNTAYFGLSYLDVSEAALKLKAESYFGKFYGSAKLEAEFDIPAVFPVRVSPFFTLNRWDYFRSFSTFFEDVKPSFLVQNELYYGARFSIPVGNKLRTDVEFRGFQLEDQYYQILNFTSADTADFTSFDGQTAIFRLQQRTLNRKQWASEGHFYEVQFRYVQGREQSVSGTTADEFYDIRKLHRWISLSAEAQTFTINAERFKLGIHGKGVFNSQSLFANYTASVLTTTEFSPLPDSKTFFLAEYRAPQYVGMGVNLIFSITSSIDFRVDPYLFQPFRQIVRFENGAGFGYDDLFKQGTYMAAASLIYHSPIGPIRLTSNYFPNQEKPLSLQVSFGYVLFNQRALR
ncbi:MAG: patatin-like phospholipase family protein [Crocinitomicaceae bacterium]|nr:patatin-like phospholipase family protein [Crocinitomicaceae bacterium]